MRKQAKHKISGNMTNFRENTVITQLENKQHKWNLNLLHGTYDHKGGVLWLSWSLCIAEKTGGCLLSLPYYTGFMIKVILQIHHNKEYIVSHTRSDIFKQHAAILCMQSWNKSWLGNMMVVLEVSKQFSLLGFQKCVGKNTTIYNSYSYMQLDEK